MQDKNIPNDQTPEDHFSGDTTGITPEQMPDTANLTQQKIINQQIRRREFISFSVFTILAASGIGAWEWLYHAPKETGIGVTGTARIPLRKAMNQTELFFRKIFSNKHLVKTYPASMAEKNVRVNSFIGIDDKQFNPKTWKLMVEKTGSPFEVSIQELRSLPKTEIVYSFKCVEGWDQIQHWAGVRFSDFIAHYGLDAEVKMNYLGLETPDQNYYVGIDMESAMHPQTILAYEMNGNAILAEHGAPLRLIIPVKYGIKNLKRIGTMSFSNDRPADYWAELGYDYYSGL